MEKEGKGGIEENRRKGRGGEEDVRMSVESVSAFLSNLLPSPFLSPFPSFSHLSFFLSPFPLPSFLPPCPRVTPVLWAESTWRTYFIMVPMTVFYQVVHLISTTTVSITVFWGTTTAWAGEKRVETGGVWVEAGPILCVSVCECV